MLMRCICVQVRGTIEYRPQVGRRCPNIKHATFSLLAYKHGQSLSRIRDPRNTGCGSRQSCMRLRLLAANRLRVGNGELHCSTNLSEGGR
jgi:hypothetical protein